MNWNILISDVTPLFSEEPEIKVTVGNTTTIRGDKIELKCEGTGIPIPQMFWFKGKTIVH